MYVCMYVCMHAFMYTSTCIHTRTRVRPCVCVRHTHTHHACINRWIGATIGMSIVIFVTIGHALAYCNFAVAQIFLKNFTSSEQLLPWELVHVRARSITTEPPSALFIPVPSSLPWCVDREKVYEAAHSKAKNTQPYTRTSSSGPPSSPPVTSCLPLPPFSFSHPLSPLPRRHGPRKETPTGPVSEPIFFAKLRPPITKKKDAKTANAKRRNAIFGVRSDFRIYKS